MDNNKKEHRAFVEGKLAGKWHLGFCNSAFLPTNRGFQHHYGYWLGAQVQFFFPLKNQSMPF